MTKMKSLFRRADGAAALAVAFMIATATGAGSAGKNAGTEHQYKDHSQVQLAAVIPSRETFAGAVRIVDLTPALQTLAPIKAVVIEPSADELAMAKLASEQRCLAEAMYYEARGEGVEGEMAIAEVIFHRMHRRNYPRSICGVVYQGADDSPGCQFSFVCNGEMLHKKTPADWAHARLLAAKIMGGNLHLGNSTDGATSFHAVDVEPDWSDNLERTVQIGNHVFYRPLPHTRSS